jgi:hypothetical protein
VSWTTDEPATSLVDYGTTATYGSQASGPNGVTSHSVPLPGLLPETEYHYRVSSTDTCGNGPAQSADGTLTTGPASIDVSGWVLKQFTSSQTFTIPAGTTIPAGGYLVVGRDATLSEFQAAHPGFPPGTVYLDSNANGACSTAGCFPQINGDETFELYDAANVKLDGATVAMSVTHRAYQRNHPQDAAGTTGSWTIVDESLANPGSGAGPGNGAGVRINEMADAADFTQEYVELYYDATTAAPDTIPPAAVANLDAVPITATSIRLTWSAPGDDGGAGTATSYDVRRSSRPIASEADFAAATPLPSPPSPLPAGSPQTFDVTGLTADTGYHFAMKTVDDASNVSGRSNTVSAVTAPAGGGGPTVNHLVISQIRVNGTTDDVVEIFNPTASPISLANTSVQYLAANGNFGFRVNLTAAGSVPARGWYLVAANGYVGTPARNDSLGTSNMSNSAGHALLVAKTTNVTGCTDVAIVDKVGYGARRRARKADPGMRSRRPAPGARSRASRATRPATARTPTSTTPTSSPPRRPSSGTRARRRRRLPRRWGTCAIRSTSRSPGRPRTSIGGTRQERPGTACTGTPSFGPRPR